MELQAALHTLHLTTPDPLQAARFYSQTYEMAMEPAGEGYLCRGPGRRLQLSPGPANQLGHAQFVLHTDAAWTAFTERTAGLPKQSLPPGFAGNAASLCFRDPDGNQLVFSPPEPAADGPATRVPGAILQHFGMRTASLDSMLAFYTGQLGFVLSDAVRDPEGNLRACFLRTDVLHHALALFFAPEARFDHQSFEAPDWSSMRVWGDHMAALRVPIVWGIGRHGPGNDVFFMVADPDGNLAEISSEIEHCEPGRPAGLWPHEERTLNVWGKAIMRS
ncbi:MAG: Glyoxalase/bleomycin resistance protein/dioxygenase [Polaromonas sp.]|nr:Glyoxalase/bleomycin resistance protein/dioxygenase [Polaromonas sp.]